MKDSFMHTELAIFKERRRQLLYLLQQSGLSEGLIMLVGSFENKRYQFRQESSFYYLTGIVEPGAVFIMTLDGTTTLYVPRYSIDREGWVSSALLQRFIKEEAIDHVEFLGEAFRGYEVSPLFTFKEYKNLCELIESLISKGKKIYTCASQGYSDYREQKQLLERLTGYVPALSGGIYDISGILAQMRRKKSREEIERIYKAVDLTLVAQEAAARVIDVDKKEYEIKAGIDYVFAESGATSAFPTIVASGSHSTILHHIASSSLMKKGDVVVIDCGAELDYYCADVTRTYPVSGVFSKRQRELYTIVLDCYKLVESKAQPGCWLNNKDYPEKSLYHIAQSFFKKYGYEKYFTHNIGHFLGMDVHDVGTADPLQEGDVITIEPGLYNKEEGLGIRIEDDLWVVKDGSICLSEALPKDIDSVEAMVQATLEAADERNYEEEEEDFNDDGTFN
jgi:Xaa-Pro aminopeptidase